MKYNLAYKHLEKIAKKSSGSRPILQGIKHENDTMIATDSHRLLTTTIDNMTFETHVLSTHTGENIEHGNYPETSKLLPNSDNADSRTIISVDDIKAIRSLLKVAKQMKFDYVKVIANDNKLKVNAFVKQGNTDIDTLQKVDLSFNLIPELHHSDINIMVNLDYMIDIFEFLFETKKDTTLETFGNIRPLLFKSEDYSYIIVPIRQS